MMSDQRDGFLTDIGQIFANLVPTDLGFGEWTAMGLTMLIPAIIVLVALWAWVIRAR